MQAQAQQLSPGEVDPTRQMLPQITKTDIEAPRTQAELRLWVDTTHALFGETEEGITALRLLTDPILKIFSEETWTLALYADAYFMNRDDVMFRGVIGGQPYDAEVIDKKSKKVLRRVEITQAMDGQQTYFKMLHLEKHGRVPETGVRLEKMNVIGPAAKEVPVECVLHADVLSELVNLVKKIVSKKGKKGYSTDTTLVVEVHDFVIHNDRDKEKVLSNLNNSIPELAGNITEVVVLGSTGRLHYRFTQGPESSVS